MPQIGAPELILVLVLALIIFGPGKLPELGKAVGKTIKEFRRSSQEIIDEVEISNSAKKEEKQATTKTIKS